MMSAASNTAQRQPRTQRASMNTSGYTGATNSGRDSEKSKEEEIKIHLQ